MFSTASMIIITVLRIFAGNNFSEMCLKGFQVRSHQGLAQQHGYLLLLSVSCWVCFNFEFSFSASCWLPSPFGARQSLLPKPAFLTKDLPANCRIISFPLPFLMNLLILCTTRLHPGPSAPVFRAVLLSLCGISFSFTDDTSLLQIISSFTQNPPALHYENIT